MEWTEWTYVVLCLWKHTVGTLGGGVTGLRLSSESSAKLALHSPDVKPVNSMIALLAAEKDVPFKLWFWLDYLLKLDVTLITPLFSQFKNQIQQLGYPVRRLWLGREPCGLSYHRLNKMCSAQRSLPISFSLTGKISVCWEIHWASSALGKL